jgi:nucleoside-diphosphate-sugar epimerase
MARVLVTGANGFVAQALLPCLLAAGHDVVGLVRRLPAEPLDDRIAWKPAGELADVVDWSGWLTGVDVVVHLAGRAHVGREAPTAAAAAFRRGNVEVSERLANAAVAAGVKRFIFLSSVKAAGERSTAQPFADGMTEHPEDAYGQSKLEAEHVLEGIAEVHGMSLLILRPPLVYGPGVKANFRALMNWVAAGWPLPFASIDNCRSLLFVGNLVDAICSTLMRIEVRGAHFLSDDECLSTPELVRRLAHHMGHKVRLFPFPTAGLHMLLSMIGRRGMAERLTQSLRVDSSGFRSVADWQHPFTVDAGLAEAARDFVATGGEKR